MSAMIYCGAMALAGGMSSVTAASKGADLMDLKGAPCAVPSPQAKATVLFFVAHDCPITNAYAPEMNRIVTAYTPKRVAFRVVYVETDAANDLLAKHAKEYGFRCPSVHDAKHAVVSRVGATTTPEAVVLGPSGQILYRGRIDDQYATFGVRRTVPKHRNLREALDAVSQGKPVAVASAPALGCAIPPLN